MTRSFPTSRPFIFACAFALAHAAVSAFAQDSPGSAGVDFFEKRIRPLLTDKCYECHAATAKKVKGNQLPTAALFIRLVFR